MLSQPFTRVRAILSEIIGGPSRIVRYFFPTFDNGLTAPKRDVGRADSTYWDRARRGKARGLEISGLLLKPLASKIASWTLGRPPQFRLENDEAETALNDWWRANRGLIMQAYEDVQHLADMWILVNSDLSLTILNPDMVQPVVNPENFGETIGWRIEVQYPNPAQPTETQTRIEIWTPQSRRVRILQNGRGISDRTFPNLIGRVPLVHIKDNGGADEDNGRPVAEPLLPMLLELNEVLYAAIKGNKRQGRPTPTLERMGDRAAIEAFIQRYGRTVTHELPDGTTETEKVIGFDGDKLMMAGGDSVFNYKSPAPFVNETRGLSDMMGAFYVFFSELPAWVLGNPMPGSMASANTQVEALTRFIEKKQAGCEGWIMELALIVMGYNGIVNPAARADERPTIKWEELTTKDNRIVLDAIVAALDKGILDEETALQLMPLDIEDPEAVLAKARAEREERRQQDQEDSIQRSLDQAEANARNRDEAAGDEPPAERPSANPERARRVA